MQTKRIRKANKKKPAKKCEPFACKNQKKTAPNREPFCYQFKLMVALERQVQQVHQELQEHQERQVRQELQEHRHSYTC